MAATEAQKKAVKKYKETKIRRVSLEMPIELYEQMKVCADLLGEPVNKYIKTAIQDRMSTGK